MTSTTSTGVSPELLQEVADAFNSRDADRIASHFTEDATFVMASGPGPLGEVVQGRETIRKVLAGRFQEIPDMRWERLYEYVAGHRAVSVWRVKGTSDDGEAIDFQGCDLWEFEGNLVKHKDTYWKIVTDESPLERYAVGS